MTITEEAVQETEDIHVLGDEAHELRLAHVDVGKARDAYEDASEIAKAMKKALDRAEAHREILLQKAMGDAEPLPLFDGNGDGEDWKGVALSNLTAPPISDKILKCLTDAGLNTIVELAEIQAGDGFQLRSIKGVGPAGATEIENALEGFWVHQDAKKVGEAQK